MPARATRLELAIFTLAMLALSGAPTTLYTKLSGYSPPTPDIAVILPILGLMVVNLLVRLRATVLGSLAAWPWILFAGLALASYTWSIAPSDTLREAVVMCVAVPYLAMSAFLMDWRDIIARAWGVGVALAALSLLLYVAMPSVGSMQDVYAGALSGVFYEKNATGQFGMWTALLTLAMAAMRPTRAPIMVAIWMVLVGFVALTQSATALIATVLGGLIFAWVALMRRPRPVSLPLMWASLAVGVPAVIAIGARPELVFDLLGRTGTLTGRIPIWEAVRDFAIPERPNKGFGYSAYWSDSFAFGNRAYVYDALGFEARHAHNAWLEAKLALGPAGAWLLVAGLVQALVMTLFRMRRSAGAYLALPVLAGVILTGMVEVSPVAVSNWAGALWVIVLTKMTLDPSHQDRQSGFADMLTRLSPQKEPTRGYGATPIPV